MVGSVAVFQECMYWWSSWHEGNPKFSLPECASCGPLFWQCSSQSCITAGTALKLLLITHGTWWLVYGRGGSVAVTCCLTAVWTISVFCFHCNNMKVSGTQGSQRLRGMTPRSSCIPLTTNWFATNCVGKQRMKVQCVRQWFCHCALIGWIVGPALSVLLWSDWLIWFSGLLFAHKLPNQKGTWIWSAHWCNQSF